MKHKLLNKLLTLALLTLGGVILNPAWANNNVSTVSTKFSANGNVTSNFTQTGDFTSATWNLSVTWKSTASWQNLEPSRGAQIGSGNAPATGIVLTGSSIPGTITSVVVNTAGASSINATVAVAVAGTVFKCNNNTTASLTSSAANYTFTGSGSGDVVITWANSSSKAIYIKSITTTYSTASFSTAPTIDDGEAASNFTISKDVTISAEEGATIYYTTDGKDPDEDSDVYSSPIHITSTTTIKAVALEDGKALSSVSSKTFTKVLAGNTITVTGGTTPSVDRTGGSAVDDWTPTASATSSGTITYAIKSTSNLTQDTDFTFNPTTGKVSFLTAYKGEIVITASVAADADYAAASEDITLTVNGNKRTPVIAYDGEDTEISNGGTFVIDPDLIETDGAITVTSSNPSVASVSTYTITGEADGTVTITVSTAEGTYYSAGSGTFCLEVVTPSACDIALTGAPVSKTFDVYNNATPQVITYTTSSTGTVSIAANPYAIFDIDQVNKKITVTPKSKTPSAQTITINQAATGRYLAGSATFSLTVNNSATSETYEKVTDAATLTVGDELIIVNETYSKAGGAISSSLITPVGVTISESKINLSSSTSVVTYRLGGSSGSWKLQNVSNNYYLQSTSAKSMAESATSTMTWAISISSGDAAITASGASVGNLQYNHNGGTNPRFTTYTSSQSAPQLYRRGKYNNVITVTNGTAQTLELESETDLTLSATSYCGAVSFAYKSATGLTKDTNFTFDAATGELEVDEDAPSGTITITASTVESSTHKAASVDIVITVVGKSKSEVEFALSDQTKQSGTTYTLENGVDFETDGTVTLYSTNTNVATVAGLTVTAVGVGSTTITVSCAEGTLYKEGEDDFTFTVTAPAGATTVSDVVLFNETFANCSGTGGNKSGSFENGSQSAMVAADADETYSSLSYTYAAEGCAKVGTGSYASALTTSTISLTGDATLTFSGAGWKGDETNTLSVTATGASLSGDNSITLTNATWKAYSVSISGATGSVTLTFAGKRGFLDDIKITQSPTATVTLNKYGFATYCSEKPIDFSSTEGYTAWRVSSIAADGTITFTKITEKIKGGQGVLLYNKDADGVNTSSAIINFANGTTEFTSSENKLVGTTAPVYIDEVAKIYGLSDNKFVKNNATGNIGANKAYILATSIPASVKAFNFVFVDEDDPDGIRTIENVSIEEAAQIFDLLGRRLNKAQKGINIINGKKVLY